MKGYDTCYLCESDNKGKYYDFYSGEFVRRSDQRQEIHWVSDQEITTWTEHFTNINLIEVFICQGCYIRNLWRNRLWVLGCKKHPENDFEKSPIGLIPALLIVLMGVFSIIFPFPRIFLLLGLAGFVLLLGELAAVPQFGYTLAIHNWKRKNNCRYLKTWTPSQFEKLKWS